MYSASMRPHFASRRQGAGGSPPPTSLADNVYGLCIAAFLRASADARQAWRTSSAPRSRCGSPGSSRWASAWRSARACRRPGACDFAAPLAFIALTVRRCRDRAMVAAALAAAVTAIAAWALPLRLSIVAAALAASLRRHPFRADLGCTALGHDPWGWPWSRSGLRAAFLLLPGRLTAAAVRCAARFALSSPPPC